MLDSERGLLVGIGTVAGMANKINHIMRDNGEVMEVSPDIMGDAGQMP